MVLVLWSLSYIRLRETGDFVRVEFGEDSFCQCDGQTDPTRYQLQTVRTYKILSLRKVEVLTQTCRLVHL